jgi:hypothetical protein
LLFLSFALLLSACDDAPIVPTPPPDPTSTILLSTPTLNVSATRTAIAPLVDPVLAQIPQAYAIHIKESWTDNTLRSPLVAQVSITRTGDLFLGQGYFTAADKTSTKKIKVSTSTTEEFLARISVSPLDTGRYIPSTATSGGYPSITIEIMLPTEMVLFHTMSQAYGQKPWALDLRGERYNIDSRQPRYALDELDRAIGVDDAMKDLIRQIDCTWNHGICR